MRVVVASGKGGTGKTTLATNLALSCAGDVQLLDCDVEEPDCHLFLNPTTPCSEVVGIPVPEVDEDKCTACGQCGDICQYNAIVSLGSKPIVFPELCHGCGGCALVCPEDAISEVTRPMGTIAYGRHRHIECVQGRLNIGEAMASPVIRAVRKHIREEAITFIDAPPGTSCSVVEAVRRTDYAVLVTEPTPFGLNDLLLAMGLARKLRVPFGVVINRAGIGDEQVESYCRNQDVPILLSIPNDRRIAEACSRGQMLQAALPEYVPLFSQLVATILSKVNP